MTTYRSTDGITVPSKLAPPFDATRTARLLREAALAIENGDSITAREKVEDALRQTPGALSLPGACGCSNSWPA